MEGRGGVKNGARRAADLFTIGSRTHADDVRKHYVSIPPDRRRYPRTVDCVVRTPPTAAHRDPAAILPIRPSWAGKQGFYRIAGTPARAYNAGASPLERRGGGDERRRYVEPYGVSFLKKKFNPIPRCAVDERGRKKINN